MHKVINLTPERLSTDQLWDLSAEILTELSRRNEVDYRIKATDDSVARKIKKLSL